MAAPGFSERAFEFAFNAEYWNAHKAVICGMPHIPCQREEKWLGYDVLWQLTQLGGDIFGLALQHKVSHRATQRTKNNLAFWNQMGMAPYFRFGVDPEQFNILQGWASLMPAGVAIRYCAPAFHTLAQMQAHYLAQTVLSSSIFIDITGAGQLVGGTHNATYQPGNPNAYVFSNPKKLVSSSEPPRPSDQIFTVEAATIALDYFVRPLLAQGEASNVSKGFNEEIDVIRRRFAKVNEVPQSEHLFAKVALLGVILGRYHGTTLIAQAVK